MARFSFRRTVALTVAACAVVVLGDDAGAQAKANQAASVEAISKWAAVLSNAFMASGSPDKAINNIAAFNSLVKQEMSAQSANLKKFDAEGGHNGDEYHSGNAFLDALRLKPIPQVSISDPQFFADGTANFTSTAVGVSLSSAFINYAPCLIPLSATGAGVFPQGFNIQPQLFGANPQAVNIQPQAISIAPTGLLVAPIAANLQPQGFNIAPTLFSISPIKTVVSKTGPINVAPTVIAVTIPRDGP